MSRSQRIRRGHWLGIFLALALLASCASPGGEPSPPTPQPVTATPSPAPTPVPPPLGPPPVSPAPLSVPEVVERVQPAVVSIVTERVELNIFLQPIPSRGAGSGVIFRSDGYILTNNHVVEEAEKITVNLPPSPQFPEGATFEGQVVGRDPLTDLAVVKVEAQGLPTVPFGDSQKLRLGEQVIAIGNALNLPGGPTVTVGVVSNLGRSIFMEEKGVIFHDLIQTDAAINPGNSGGPLLNLAGEVVGINSAIISGAENIGFAIATATALPVRDELVAQGKIRWPWLGVRIATLTPAMAAELGIAFQKGVLIDQVFQGDPAQRAGLRAKDIIIQFAGEETPTLEKLQKLLRRHRAGDRVEVVFVREGQTFKVGLTLAEMP